MAETYDILVIGGGPGGYVAAIRAAQLGFRTAVVEREHLGGICLNWGCIPTKALLRSAEVFENAMHGESYGLKIEKPSFEIGAVVKRSRAVSAQLNGGIGFLMKKNKIDVIWGEAKIEKAGRDGPVTVSVGPSTKPAVEPQNPVPKGTLGHGTYSAKHVIVATGSRPRVLPGIEPDGERIWTYFEAMKPATMPKSLVVMGSGAIGIEFASFYRTMGAEVTVVELLPQILPVEDAEIAAVARKQLEKQGIRILTEAKVAKVEKSGDGITATVEVGGKTEILKAERLISAVGVQGNTGGLNLEGIGVEIDRGIITVDEVGRTNVPGVYAIGDVACDAQDAHSRMYVLPSADRVGRANGGEGQGERPRAEGRAVQVPGQRQGHRARGSGGHGQDDLRRQDRRASRRTYGRPRGDRADPGFRGRDGARDHGNGTHRYGFPASDAVRGDA